MHWNFLLKKWEKLLHCKSFSQFFNKKYWHIREINFWKFNETLTNDVVSFEQPGPGCSKLTMSLVNVSLKFQTLFSQIRQ